MNLLEHDRRVLLETPSYKVHTGQLDVPEGTMQLVHLDVYKWSLGVLRELQFKWALLRQKLPPIVFCMGNDPGRKFNNFVSLFGWERIADIPCDDGYSRTLYAHFRYT